MSVVGIDLGTTNTVVACVRSGKVHVLADEQGTRLLPSVVSFHPNGEVLVGASAKARRVIDPRNTVYSHKRLIGRSWGSPEIAQAKSRFAFELKEGPGQGPLVRARGQDYTLPEISAFVLKRTRQIAETALGTPVERAVITVPAHFNELQRASTKVAGRVSGLEVLRILNEPTAAALAYGLGRTGNERVAVYDFGGGTFDCTLLDLNGNVFEVLATAGDSFLGGDDVDNMIAERMAETYLKEHRYDPRTDPQMLERLKTSAEDIKMVLSTAETHTVVLKEFGHGAGGSSVNYTFTLTRKELESMITPLVDQSFKVTQDALALARLTPTSFDKVILVGGSTRIPLVRKRVEGFFGAPPLDRVNPDEVVAIGAAIQAAALTEGMRKRSIPAPPGVIGKPRTLPGLQNDTTDNTQTSQIDPSTLQPQAPGPAFGSNPPTFEFRPASNPPVGPGFSTGPPNLGAGSNAPPNPNQAAITASAAAFATGPPAPGVPGARPHPGLIGARKPTNPGVAPGTQPMGARSPSAPAPPQSHEEDPSLASFPDLAVPTPFEWFPSSGSPASGDTAVRSGPAGSERSFGGNTITATGVEQNTLTAAVPQPEAKGGVRPAAGTPAAFGTGPGFGAIDEPPSLYSTPSASVPSFPSMTGASAQGLPSPIGEPEPFATDDSLPGQFGQVREVSLVSTSGVSTSGVSGSAITKGAGSPSSPDQFGHLPDLSIQSTSSQMSEVEGITEARQKMLEAYEDETEARVDKAGLSLEPATSPRTPAALNEIDDSVDLPAVAKEKADLPAVAARKRPEIRKPGQPALTSSGGPSMLGKPPPMTAPQPFGPMEKIGPDNNPPSRTASMQGRPPVPAGAKPAQKTKQQVAKPAPASAPLDQTTPLGAQPPRQQPPPQQPPQMSTQMSTQPVGQFGGGAPPPQAQPSFMSPPTAATSPFGGFGSSPPPQAQAFGSAPPPPQQQGFGSGPPPQFGQPAQAPGGSQPPIFGAYQSSPPGAEPVHGGFDPSMPMQQPPAPQGISFAAPVLVDVTPRGLVVETAGGYTDTIIPRNSKIPCERTRRFATGRDMQTTVRVRVGQGESTIFPQNTYLGEVELSGLRPAPRGEVVVAVTFEVDADGTLRIRARDVQTGQEARATLQLIGVADESSVVMMINRFAQQPVVGGPTGGS
ncbi:MAG: Hsp70 family protein [Labilithrix sp.]|nr:Hsp70 family protein [Labilithrix sp.]